MAERDGTDNGRFERVGIATRPSHTLRCLVTPRDPLHIFTPKESILKNLFSKHFQKRGILEGYPSDRRCDRPSERHGTDNGRFEIRRFVTRPSHTLGCLVTPRDPLHILPPKSLYCGPQPVPRVPHHPKIKTTPKN